MNVENPAAFRFLMHDDIYLLPGDKVIYSVSAINAPVTEAQPIPEVVVTPLVSVTLPATAAPPVLNFKYLGGFKKKLLIVVHYDNVEFIDAQHLTAIENILKRLGLTLDDAAIFNRATAVNTSFEQLSSFFGPEKWLILGTDALPPGIESLELNKPKLLNNRNCLYSYSFAAMMDHVEYKKIFWEQMKQL